MDHNTVQQKQGKFVNTTLRLGNVLLMQFPFRFERLETLRMNYTGIILSFKTIYLFLFKFYFLKILTPCA